MSNLLTLKKIGEFKESLIRNSGKPLSNARIDGIFNMKYGCVSSNWEKLIEFCKDYATLTLSGHTHTNREFRLDDPGPQKSSVYDVDSLSNIDYSIYIIDSCEYIVFYTGSSTWGSHKGNCKNSIHNK